MTDYSELVRDGRIKAGRFAPRQAQECLRIAQRDLETAAQVLAKSPEWAFNIGYDAVYRVDTEVVHGE